MKLFSLLPVLALGVILFRMVPAASAAESPAPTTPKKPGDALISRFIEASGGETAIRQRTSRLTKGRISVPALGVNGTMELLQGAGGKTLQTFELAPGVAFVMGSDGTVAWMNIPGIGIQEMEGDQRDQFIAESDLYRMLSLAGRFVTSEVKDTQKLGAIECDVMVGTTKGGKKETLYFSRSTGLLVRWDREILSQDGSWAQGENWLEDYRSVDGLQLPFKIRQPKPESGAFEMEFLEIRLGVPVPDDKFKKPAA